MIFRGFFSKVKKIESFQIHLRTLNGNNFYRLTKLIIDWINEAQMFIRSSFVYFLSIFH